jgi:Fe-S-cluster-containing hydrogenase component 2
MKEVSVNNDLCVKNHKCPVVEMCPVNAVQQSSFTDAPSLDNEKCIKCGKCISFCPYNAFSYKE